MAYEAHETSPRPTTLVFTDDGVSMRPEGALASDDQLFSYQMEKLAELMVASTLAPTSESYAHEDIEIGLRDMNLPLSPHVLRKCLDRGASDGWLDKLKTGNHVSWKLADTVTIDDQRTATLAYQAALTTPRQATAQTEERLPYYERLAREQRTNTHRNLVTDTSAQTAQTLRRAINFTNGLIKWTETKLAHSHDGTVKVTDYIGQLLSVRELSLDENQARTIMRNLVTAEHFHFRGTSGHRYLSRTPSSAPEPGARRTPAQREQEYERIKQLAAELKVPILQYLNTLNTHSSEFKTAIAANVVGLSIDDVNAVCAQLKDEGLVYDKMPKGRGTGRTRKGRTWGITGRGRNLLSEDQLTNAEKRKLGMTFRNN